MYVPVSGAALVAALETRRAVAQTPTTASTINARKRIVVALPLSWWWDTDLVFPAARTVFRAAQQCNGKPRISPVRGAGALRSRASDARERGFVRQISRGSR